MSNGASNGTPAWKILAITGGLTAGVIGMTVVTAGASPPPAEDVERATEVAERAAAAESAVRTLKLQSASDDAASVGEEQAQAMVSVAEELEPPTFPAVPDDWARAGVDLDEATRSDTGELVQDLPDGSRVVFTVDPEVQSYLQSFIEDRPVPHGSVVLLDPPTGRVVAMAENSRRGTEYQNFSRNAAPPSASVFKVITAAALMEEADQPRTKQVCYHGGRRGLTKRNITGHPDLDNQCDDLEAALARSLNSLIAKQTYHNLTRKQLLEWAERFGYNEPIPFELPVEPSTASFPDDPYETARAAAGFWHTHMSPLHGAMIGAALANEGVMMEPTIIDRYESPDGEVLYESTPEEFRQIVSADTADKLADMMTTTAETGTARRYFRHRRAFPNNVTVSGKTGTLSNKDPFLRFTWFVGFAEHRQWEDHPGVAVSGLMANDPEWHVLGPQAASYGLQHYFNVESDRRTATDEAVVTR